MSRRSIFALACASLLLSGCGSASNERGPGTPVPGASAAPSPSTSSGPPTADTEHADIRIAHPIPGQVVTSPLTVSGEAVGPWFFEASFPVKLLNDRGNVLAQAPAQAQGEWMTTSLVPFVATLTFVPTGNRGTLVLEKSNASGLPEHAGSVVVPIRF